MPWWHPDQGWWSWLLSGSSIVGTLMAGRRMASGWLVRLAAIGLWITFGVLAGQWGFVVLPAFGALAYALAWRWTRAAPRAGLCEMCRRRISDPKVLDPPRRVGAS